MIVVIFEVTGQPPQIDGYSDDVKIFNKEGFVKINDAQNQLLALYQPSRVIAIRKVKVPPQAPEAPTPGDLNDKPARPRMERNLPANSNAEPDKSDETVHQSDGAEEQQPGPDRGSTG